MCRSFLTLERFKHYPFHFFGLVLNCHAQFYLLNYELSDPSFPLFEAFISDKALILNISMSISFVFLKLFANRPAPNSNYFAHKQNIGRSSLAEKTELENEFSRIKQGFLFSRVYTVNSSSPLVKTDITNLLKMTNAAEFARNGILTDCIEIKRENSPC